MESLDNWEAWVDHSARPRSYGTISLSKDRFHQGQASILLTSPTKGEEPNYASLRGRPWGSASAIYRVDNEDWTEWNRISLWVYPDLPGFRTVSFNLVLHNDTRADNFSVSTEQWDDAFVPYDFRSGYLYCNIHSGLNYQLLGNHRWNKVYWEIPHVKRDKGRRTRAEVQVCQRAAVAGYRPHRQPAVWLRRCLPSPKSVVSV